MGRVAYRAFSSEEALHDLMKPVDSEKLFAVLNCKLWNAQAQYDTKEPA